jgi:cell division septum initiation protein DivIVA
VDVHTKLADIRRAVEEARSMPMSASAVVNRGELIELLDELKDDLVVALADAQVVIADKAAVVEQGRAEADKLLKEAREERERLVSDSEVYRVARRQADDAIADAKTEADELRRETDDYVDATLANFEIALERTLEAVRRGRERLAGRSLFHALTEDDVDSIKLPEQLGH